MIVRGQPGVKVAGATYLVFFLIHISAAHRIAADRRVAAELEWFLMSIAMLLGIAISPPIRPSPPRT